ncbi:MAG: CHAT domain-containing protein, partial [Actinomycetota bacterium]|nr:CHAT domain-containing protein [Actinomycetota bacterium]
LGLSAAFLGLGTRQLVAAVVPIPDGAAGELMTGFHHLLAEGMSTAEALARMQQRGAGGPPGARAAAAAFVCMGAGLAVPGRQRGTSTPHRPGRTGHLSHPGGTPPPTR